MQGAMNEVLPGLAVFQDALEQFGRTASTETKRLQKWEHGDSPKEGAYEHRERLHAAAIKRRRKRKRGGPK